ncbi:MAG: FAD/NAD(P)-binding protein [Gammaproteobacteria bacterium]|nr:FAD/NAD(P)-binding protein [Gammaproteobacteria bacterium]
MSQFNLPHEAEVVERIEESPTIFTLRLRLADPAVHAAYRFAPGQFNMLYLYGVGEVAISIVSDPEDEQMIAHTIRQVGRVTNGLARLQAGDRLGLRGPFGRGWPLAQAEGGDVVIATGGLGCAPVVAAINYVLRRRERYGNLIIMQGVKHGDDLIWCDQYAQWAQMPDTQVLLAASEGGACWPYHVGHLPVLFEHARLKPESSTVMMCGPEGMMIAVCRELLGRGFSGESLYLSMERNMHCGRGKCGHCQLGGKFVCQDGPIFSYPEIAPLLGVKGL